MRKISEKRVMAILMGMLFVLSAGGVEAAVDINKTGQEVTYYDGITVNATSGATLGNPGGTAAGGTGANLDLICKLGAGIAGTSQRFLRFDLSNGAKFKENPSCMIDIYTT